MTISKSYTFADPENFSFDSDLIDFTAVQKPRLKLTDNTLQTFNQPFTADTGFTYNSSNTEFTGGLSRQIDKAPTDSVCWATYTTDKDLNASINSGSLVGTLVNGATVSGGYLDLTGGASSYADYAGLNNVDTLIQEGTIKFIVKPNYSGTPSGIRNFIVISEASGDASNLVNIYHKSSDGNLKAVMNNQVLGTIMSEDLGLWNPTAGTDYEFELNFIIDTAVGANTFIRLFIDGIQFGATKTGVTGTRSSNIGLIRVGTNVGTGDLADHSVKDLIFFDTVQHTSNYTPGYTLDEARYLGDVITLPTMPYSGAGNIQVWTNIIATMTNNPRLIMNDQYYSGGWVASSDSWATASTIADVLANIATLPATDAMTIKVVTNNGNDQMSISDLTLTYTGQIYSITNPTIEFLESFTHEGLEAFTETSTKTGSDEVKYVLTKDGINYYYDSVTELWIVSDGTYTQTNTATEISANKASFIEIGVTTKIIAYLHSDDGSTTPTLTQVDIEFDFYSVDVTAPSPCVVYGWIYDENGNVVENASVVAVPSELKGVSGDKTISLQQKTGLSDSSGYWELELIASNNTGIYYNFYFNYDNHSQSFARLVPNEQSKAFGDLEEI